MRTKLDTKLWRDVMNHRGQVIAIILVVACGVATYVAMRSSYASLLLSRQAYYTAYRFADVFASLKRGPDRLLRDIAGIPGVVSVQARIVRDVTVDIPGNDEPVTGRLVSVPAHHRPILNDLFIREGRYIEPGRQDEALISEAFALANGLRVGDRIGAVLNGRLKSLRIAGIVLSPEYVYEVRGMGELFPDSRRFGVLWMGQEAMAAAFDMQGAFNDIALMLTPGASERAVIARLDRYLGPYGGLGAYGRDLQVSSRFLADEIAGNYASGTVTPLIFFGVAAFLLHIVMSRLVRTQRDQIAILKAFGYANRTIGWHYVKFAWLSVAGGLILGIAAGVWLGQAFTEIYRDFYRFPVLRYELGPDLLLAATLITGGAATVGAFSTMRQAISLPPAEAMRPEAPERFHSILFERLGVYRIVSSSARMILRNFERRPVKSLLSILSIALAVAILVVGRSAFDGVDFLIAFQFRTVQREDVTVAFAGPLSARAVHDLSHLPGVLSVEPYRIVPVRLRYGHRAKMSSLFGLPPDGQLRRLIDQDNRLVPLPEHGVVMTTALAEMLGVSVGDLLTLEVLEGSRPTVQTPLVARIDEMIGVALYMDIRSVHRLLGEGPAVSGAFLDVDAQAIRQLYATIKRTPGVAGVSLREATIRNFEQTVAESMAISTVMLILFSSVIAAGMVYNGARIALSERSRELASLRVIGFTRQEVTVLLLGEQAIIMLLAMPIGCMIGWGLSWLIVKSFASELYRLPVIISLKTYVFTFLIVATAAAGSGWLIRRRLQHLDLIGVLKTRE